MGKMNNCLFIAVLQEGKKDIKYYYKSQFIYLYITLTKARVFFVLLAFY